MTLRSRLLLGLGVAFAVFVAAAVFIVLAQRAQLYAQVDDQLRATPLPPDPRADGGQGQDRQPARDANAAVSSADAVEPPISDLFLAAISVDGEAVPIIEGQLLVDRPSLETLMGDPPPRGSLTDVDGEDGISRFRVLYIPGPQGSQARVVAVPLDNLTATVRQLTYTFVAVGVFMATVLGLIGYWVSRFGLRPIADMTEAAGAIAGGQRDRRVHEFDDTTEAGRLASAFNTMLDERDIAEDRLRQFVSNASHELRTPLTSIRGYLDLYAQGGFRQPGQMDDAVRRMQFESERMTLLVEDLLLLAKLDEDQPLSMGPVDVPQMLEDIVASALAANPDRDIKTTGPRHADEQAFGDQGGRATIKADGLRLHQAIAGLVDNAVTHTPPEATVLVGVSMDDATAEITVADNGPGLPEGAAVTIFDRFYRGDRSRSRASGGSGLGLSITKAIVESHGGEISAGSGPEGGARFTVTLPTGR